MRGGFAVPLFVPKNGRGTRAVSPCTLFALLRPALAGSVPGVKFLRLDLSLLSNTIDFSAATSHRTLRQSGHQSSIAPLITVITLPTYDVSFGKVPALFASLFPPCA